MEKLTAKTLALAPWSYSKARMALECPFQFDLKYTTKAKPGPQVRSPELLIGSALHKILELLIKGVQLDTAVNAALEEISLTSEEVETVRGYDYQLDDFIRRIEIFQNKHGVTRRDVFVEKRVAISQDFTPSQYWASDGSTLFRGQWDLGMRTKSQHVIIVDHKRRGKAELAPYEQQLKLYAITALSLFPTLVGVKSAIHFIESGVVLWADMYSKELIMDQLRPEFMTWLNNAAEQHNSGTIAVGNYCRWCPYKDDICLPERANRRRAHKAEGAALNIIQR